MKPKTIRALRRQLDLTQEEFARRLGVNRTAVIRWEHGYNTPHKIFREKMKDLARDGS